MNNREEGRRKGKRKINKKSLERSVTGGSSRIHGDPRIKSYYVVSFVAFAVFFSFSVGKNRLNRASLKIQSSRDAIGKSLILFNKNFNILRRGGVSIFTRLGIFLAEGI